MRDDGLGNLMLSPTDLTKHLACGHITTLDLAVAKGERGAPEEVDEALELIFRLGLEHEDRYLQHLKDSGHTVAEIDTELTHEARLGAERQTVEAMRSGVDVVYQATLYDGRWGGQVDFLLKVDEPSALGPHSYEIADTKLARRMKVPALLQMATYAQRLAVLQGVEPRRIYVVTGDGVSRPWRLVDVAACARRARERLRAAVEQPPQTEPVPVPYCPQCRWSSHCELLEPSDGKGLLRLPSPSKGDVYLDFEGDRRSGRSRRTTATMCAARTRCTSGWKPAARSSNSSTECSPGSASRRSRSR